MCLINFSNISFICLYFRIISLSMFEIIIYCPSVGIHSHSYVICHFICTWGMASFCPETGQETRECTSKTYWTVDRFTKNFFWKFKKWIVNSMEDYQTKHVRIFFWSQMSLLHKVLDPPSYTRDLQRAKFWKSILGHNFWMECPTDLNSTPLSYIFNALFRDIPLAYLTQHLTRDICDACDVTDVTCVTHVT